MDKQLYASLLAGETAWINLSARAKWRLSGADRVRYLNGQVTNDVRTASLQNALHACVTNVKGRVEGDVFIHVSEDGQSLLLDAEAGLRDALGIRLERYIIADDAVLEDLTEEQQLWHCLGTAVPQITIGQAVANSARFNLPGTDVWLSADAPSPGGIVLSEEDAETLRILQKVPASPQELNPDSFPQEAGLESSAMSFTKGCYIGQEILSRIKTTGKMPRQLIAWSAAAGTSVAAGDALQDAEGKEVGEVTSVTGSPDDGGLAGLAYVKQAASALESFQTASAARILKR